MAIWPRARALWRAARRQSAAEKYTVGRVHTVEKSPRPAREQPRQYGATYTSARGTGQMGLQFFFVDTISCQSGIRNSRIMQGAQERRPAEVIVWVVAAEGKFKFRIAGIANFFSPAPEAGHENRFGMFHAYDRGTTAVESLISRIR